MSEEVNRFEPSLYAVESLRAAYPIVLASQPRRLGTLIVDYFCYFVFSFLVGIAVVFLFGEVGVDALRGLPDFLLGVALLTVYYLFFEGLWGRTPGKLVFGTIVVNHAGEMPTFRQVLIRTLCRFIPFEPFSFLGQTGWHDSVSKTHVVLARRPDPFL